MVTSEFHRRLAGTGSTKRFIPAGTAETGAEFTSPVRTKCTAARSCSTSERGSTSVGRLARHTRRACTRGARTRAGAGTSLSAPLTPPRHFPAATRDRQCHHPDRGTADRTPSTPATRARATASERESMGDRQQQHAHGAASARRRSRRRRRRCCCMLDKSPHFSCDTQKHTSHHPFPCLANGPTRSFPSHKSFAVHHGRAKSLATKRLAFTISK
jgi:hypothetical protein